MIKRCGFIMAFLVLTLSGAFSQLKDSCKVLLNKISGTYEGMCKNGLANGKGTAKGDDTYVGMFKNGLPEGKGKYTYKNGNSFSGYWSKGLKNGKGKYTFYVKGEANIQEGYWVNGDYVGPSNLYEFYKVTNLSGIENYIIKKLNDGENQIKISFVGAMTKYIPSDINITTSSGQVNIENKNFSIYNYTCPTNCAIHFTIKTAGGFRECNFTFVILRSGKYEVLITNS